jgi:hypothetical protein
MEITDMTEHKLTYDGAAAVDTGNHWRDAKEFPPPLSAKMLLIDKKLGVAVLGSWRAADGWTHWAPLPTFKKP